MDFKIGQEVWWFEMDKRHRLLLESGRIDTISGRWVRTRYKMFLGFWHGLIDVNFVYPSRDYAIESMIKNLEDLKTWTVI